MFIGQLARKTGLTTKTIRFYEAIGLLPEPQRSEGGYRLYPREAVETLRFIRTAQGLGFTLAEIKGLLCQSYEDACAYVEQIARGKLEQFDAEIRELHEKQERLAAVVSRVGNGCCQPGGVASSGCGCACSTDTALLACLGS